MATKLERLARALVAADKEAQVTLDYEPVRQCINELSDFLNYLDSPEVRRGSPELMERRPLTGWAKATRDAFQADIVDPAWEAELNNPPMLAQVPKGSEEVILPSPRESEAPPIEHPIVPDQTAIEALIDAVAAIPPKPPLYVFEVESFDPAEQETKP